MAIVPVKDNFQVGVQPFSARVSGGPAPADVTRNGRLVAQGLMAADRIWNERERVDAAAEANAFALFLDNQTNALSERKGVNAYKNEDGTLVADTLKRNVADELSRMRQTMSASKREKFDAMVLPYQRNFERCSARYIQGEYSKYEQATLEDTKAQYGKMAFSSYATDPDAALQALNDFHGVAKYQAMKNGADEKLANSVANKHTSGVVRGVIDDALQNGDLATAKAYQERYSKIMSADDLIHTHRVIKTQESIQIGENYANQIFSAGAVQYGSDANSLYDSVMQAESGGRRYGKDGKLLTSSKGAQGEMQVMPDTAKKPGFGITPAKDGSPEELARVGREYLDKMTVRYQGDLSKVAAAYNAGPGAVDKLVREYGNDWLSHAPKETQDYVPKVLAEYRKREKAPVKLMSVAEFAEKAKETFGGNKEAYRSAVDHYSVKARAFEESRKAEQQETLMTIYDMADEGKTMTEIEQTGAFDRLDHKHTRDAIDYIEKNVSYDFDLVAELDSDPEKLSQTDLKELRGKIPKRDINRFARKQAIARTDQGRNTLEKLTFDMRTVLLQSGVNLSSTKKNDIETRAKLNDYMTSSLEAFRAEHKRYPNDRERLEMLKNAVGEIVVPIFFGLWNTSVRRFEASEEDFVNALSTPERVQILKVAEAAGIQGSEEEKILTVLRSKGMLE